MAGVNHPVRSDAIMREIKACVLEYYAGTPQPMDALSGQRLVKALNECMHNAEGSAFENTEGIVECMGDIDVHKFARKALW